MSTLHDRLADLADDAPPGGPVPGLWDRGRRYQRRRRTGTLVIAAAVVLGLLAIGSLDWWHARSGPEPTSPEGLTGLRLPERFYAPSPRTPVADEPFGPLVAVLGAERSGTVGGGLVGVSGWNATDRFLDLPGYAVGQEGSEDVALSSDGTELAYWYSDDSGALRDRAIAGLAVYDTVTGEVSRYPVDSDHGVQPDGVAWAGHRVWFTGLSYDGDRRRSASGRWQVSWAPDSDEHTALTDTRAPALRSAFGANGVLLDAGGHQVSLWDADQLRRTRTAHVGRALLPGAMPGPDGSLTAALEDPDGDPATSGGRTGRLLVLRTSGPNRMSAHVVPGVTASAVVGWRDGTHAVVFDDRDSTYSSVDIRTGNVDELAVSDVTPRGPGLQVAHSAWAAPTYSPAVPADPGDPCSEWRAAVLVVAVGAGALVVWRRRVRP